MSWIDSAGSRWWRFLTKHDDAIFLVFSVFMALVFLSFGVILLYALLHNLLKLI